jgi:hypothetical protein
MAEASSRDLVKFKADPVLRRAIKLRAAYEDVDLQDVIVGILTEALAEEIAEVQRRGLISDKEPAEKPQKPSRKKSEGKAE